jgi:hypothetical protein
VLDSRCDVGGDRGRVAQDVEQVAGGRQRLRDLDAVGREDREQLGDDRASGSAGEHRAEWAVEVEQQAARSGEQLRELVDRGRDHDVAGRLTVVQMVSNQVRICSTYCDPVEVSSSVVVW